jgi:photosystem II stability/assembly factor-like uncharacterized protein
MKSFFFKIFLLIAVLVVSSASNFAQYDWQKYTSNPLNIHGTSGTWDESVIGSCVIFNSDLNRYEMWYTSYTGSLPNNGIGFAWSTDGITWTKYPTAVLTPSSSSWDYPFIGAACVLKEGGTYKMWYTGGQSGNLSSSHIGYATSTNCTTWTKHDDPVLNPGTGWESGAVGYPSVIKISDTYYMFYSGAVTVGIARTGRAMSSDGITWQKDTLHNPVLPAGDPGQWDRNNYLAKVIELNNTLYIYYTAESNPGVGGSAIGGAVSTDLGISWTKFENNPILPQGTSGQWDYGWIEGPCPVFAHNELKLYYDGGGAATSWLGRIGLAISDPLPAGTYTVGTGGNFATIDSAFNKLSIDGIAGAVTLELIDELYQTPNNGYFLLTGPIPGADSSNRITMRPAENRNVVIEGNGADVLYFKDVSYLTLDGIGLTGSATLTVRSIYSSYTTCALDFQNNCDYNIIRSITVFTDNYIDGYGIYMWVGYSGTDNAPDYNLIDNNFIKEAGIGIYLKGETNSNPVKRPKGNIIRGNMIGSATDSLIAWGIQSQVCQNTIIENNKIQNIRNYKNFVCPGINAFGDHETIIRNNAVHNIYEESGTEWGVHGISLTGNASWTGVNNLVYNNMVYDIRTTAPQADKEVAGIKIWYQNNPGIYFNTVNLSGTGPGYNGSAALYIRHNCTDVHISNNVLVNSRIDTPKCASAIFIYPGSSIISDYNDLFYNPSEFNCLVRDNSTDYKTLAAWQVSGNDASSITEMPFFIPPDLHIDSAIGTNIESLGIPIAGIDMDLDGQLRNSTSPDIGADEFEGEIPEFWQMQYSDKPSNMMPIKFAPISEEVCWATAYSRTPPHSGTYLRTTNGGINWIYNKIAGTENFRSDWIYAKDINTAYIVTGKVGSTGHTGIYKTTDGGLTWQKHPTAFLNSFWEICYIHFFDESNGVAIGQPKSYTDDYYEIYTTSNDGVDWVRVPDANIPPVNPVAYVSYPGMSAYGDCIWVPTVTNSPNLGNPRIFKSTDKGYTWSVTEIDLPNSSNKQYWLGLAFENETTGILTTCHTSSTEAIIKKTTDGGETWFDITKPLDLIVANSICVIPGLAGGYVVAGGVNDGTAYTVDGGDSWSLIDTKPNYVLTFFSNEIGWSIEYPVDRICKYIGPAIISSIDEKQLDELPTEFIISQNYPNPFNPSTTFRYSIPTQSKVVIKVYDILGNEIATLIDEEKPVGTYELTWNAANLSSGIYFYQLKAGDYVIAKKMILLK